jgi:GntR family transcriptional repressor for pyruvate dehydrogenase complex
VPDTDLHARFRTYLLDGEFTPGDGIDGEIALADRFGVSRGAIREVIMHYCHLGLLERVRNRGTTVRAVPTDGLGADLALCFGLAGFTFEEMKEARRLIEDAVVALVARRLTPADRERLHALIAAMEAEHDFDRANQLDRDFHLALVTACGNPCLGMFAGVIQSLFRRRHRQRYRSRAAVAASVAGHRAILAALEQGDADTARRLLDDHIAPT